MTTRVHMFGCPFAPSRDEVTPLFRCFPSLLDQASQALGFSVSESLLLSNDFLPRSPETTHGLQFLREAVAFLSRLLADGRLPHVVAGHGVSEFSALFAAGVLDFPTGLQAVRERARLLSQIQDWSSAVVVGLPADPLREILIYAGLDSLEITSWEGQDQFTLGGPAADLAAALPLLQHGGAWHAERQPDAPALGTKRLAAQAKSFAAVLESLTFLPPRLPVLSNVTALPHDFSTLKQNLVRQLTHPLRWWECRQWLQRQPAARFHFIGAGRPRPLPEGSQPNSARPSSL